MDLGPACRDPSGPERGRVRETCTSGCIYRGACQWRCRTSRTSPIDRGIELDAVGIAGVRYPVTFNDGRVEQASTATFDVTVTLPADRRGTHMSRMVEIVHDHLQRLRSSRTPRRPEDGRGPPRRRRGPDCSSHGPQLSCRRSRVGQEPWQTADVEFRATRDGDRQQSWSQAVGTDVTSLCPCSKAISDYGAHNQRSRVTLTTSGHDDVLLPACQSSRHSRWSASIGSSPVFPIIKRSDERVVTMDAHDHPAFVEDMARRSVRCLPRARTSSIR